MRSSLCESASDSCAKRSEALSSGFASAMPTTPPIARAEPLLRGGPRAAGRRRWPRARACVAASSTERSCSAYAGHRRVELGHEIGAAPQLGVDVAPGGAACGCARVIRRLTSSTTQRRRRSATSAATTQISTQRGYQRSAAGSMRVGSRAQRGGVEAGDELGRRAAARARSSRPALCREPADDRARIGAAARAARRGRPRRGAWRGARRRRRAAAGRAHGRARASSAEQLVEPQLAAGRGEQVGAAHDVRDALGGVVDDDGQLVGDDAVAAAHDDVAARALERSRCGPSRSSRNVDLALHAHAQRRRAAERQPLARARSRRELAAACRCRSARRGRAAPRRRGARRRASRSTRRATPRSRSVAIAAS